MIDNYDAPKIIANHVLQLARYLPGKQEKSDNKIAGKVAFLKYIQVMICRVLSVHAKNLCVHHGPHFKCHFVMVIYGNGI